MVILNISHCCLQKRTSSKKAATYNTTHKTLGVWEKPRSSANHCLRHYRFAKNITDGRELVFHKSYLLLMKSGSQNFKHSTQLVNIWAFWTGQILNDQISTLKLYHSSNLDPSPLISLNFFKFLNKLNPSSQLYLSVSIKF